MKRLLVLISVLCFVLSLASCKSGDGKEIDVAAAADAVRSVDIGGEKPFSGFTDATAEYLTTVMGVDASLLSDFALLVSDDDMDPRMVMLLVPSDGNRDEVKNEAANALQNYQKRWDNYLPEQAGVVQNRMETEAGSCLVYIISDDNDAVLDAVRSAAK